MPAQVTFLIGPAGSGKSKRIETSLAACMREGRRAALFVPEQCTYETERRLSLALGGLIGIDVLSFTRFSERMLAPVAKAQGRPFLAADGRRMVFKRSIHRLKGKLLALAPAAEQPGFAGRMEELYAMTRRFEIPPAALLEAAKSAPPALADKLSDLALLFSDVESFLSERYLDSEEAFTALLPLLPTSPLAGAEVYFDGFDLLTAQLFALFSGILACAGRLTIAICMEAGAREERVFAPEARAYEKLLALAREQNCEITIERLKAPAPKRPTEALIRELFAHPIIPYAGDSNGIEILSAATRAREAEAVADRIARLAKAGVRYRDIGIIAGDMPAYAALLERALGKRNIPVFLDARREMASHPAAILLLAATKAAIEGFPAGEVLRIARTGLAGVDAGACEYLESHILDRRLRGGKQLSNPFPDAPAEAEEARGRIMEPLLALQLGLRLGKTAGEKAEALRSYLLELEVEEQLKAEAERLEAEKRYALMQEHAQTYERIATLLEQLSGILGDVKMEQAAFLAVLEEAIGEAEVGLIPAAADQALLGTITRTRSRALHTLFILGCNEGIFPAPHPDDGILDDDDLAHLRAAGLSPWGSTSVRAENERFGLYQALSRARAGICFSYACSDGRREWIPSSLLRDVERVFPDVLKSHAPVVEELALPESEEAGFRLLLSALSRHEERKSPEASALYEYYQQSPAYGERLREARSYRDAPLSPPALGEALAERLYGPGSLTTASRLETYHQCPYRHFLRYGLHAEARQEAEKSEKGSFSHLVLERFGRAAAEQGIDGMSPADAKALLDAIFPGCLMDYKNGKLLDHPRLLAEAMLHYEILEGAILAILAQFQAGDFRPIGFEWEFGPGKAHPAIEIPLPGGGKARLVGKIDRVDCAATAAGAYLRVVDYKTGGASFSEEALMAGIELQLPLYLAAAATAAAEESIPAGVPTPAGLFYQPIRDAQAESEERRAHAMRLHGVLLDDDANIESTEHALKRFSAVVHGLEKRKEGFHGSALRDQAGIEGLIAAAKARAGEAFAAIRAGEAAVYPLELPSYQACRYCAYRAICRYEKGLLAPRKGVRAR